MLVLRAGPIFFTAFDMLLQLLLLLLHLLC
jgi:hypothetical protein